MAVKKIQGNPGFEDFETELQLMMKVPPHKNVCLLLGAVENPFCIITGLEITK